MWNNIQKINKTSDILTYSKKIKMLLLAFFLFIGAKAMAQWQPDARLTTDPSTSYTSYNNSRCVGAQGDTVHVIWEDSRNGAPEIYYKRSSDGGISWGADTRLTNNSFTSWFPSVSVNGSNVHVVWFDDRDGNYEIYYKKSTDGGTSWGNDIRLTNDPFSSGRPSIFATDSEVHVAWGDTRNGGVREIYYKRSADGGITWGPDIRLTNDPSDSRHASISASGFYVHVLWIDLRDGNYEVYYKGSTDGGLSWGTDTRLTNTPTVSEYPLLTTSGSMIHVVWVDGPVNPSYIFYKHSSDNGITWQPDVQLTNSATSISISPSLTVSDSILHLVWQDNRNGNNEIFYNQSLDSGASWGTDSSLTNNSASSENPFIAVSENAVHIIWQDNRDGNYEIYYKQDPTGNAVGIEENSTGHSFSIAPNPILSGNNFIVTLHSESAIGDSKLKIFNALGENIYTEKLESKSQTINCGYLSSGIYLVKINNGEKIFVQKVIIQ